MRISSYKKNFINLEHISSDEAANKILAEIKDSLESASKDGYKHCELSMSIWYNFIK